MINNKKIKSGKLSVYEGFSFVEMIITLLIVGMVLVITSATLAALIRASAISSAKTMSRSESEFVLEIVEKAILNSQSDYIEMYKSYAILDPVTGTISWNLSEPQPQIPILVDSGLSANEIHFRPIRSQEWVCIGFVQDTKDNGYVVKSSSPTQDPNCLLSGQMVILNSEEVDIELFEILAYNTSGRNTAFVVDLMLEPVYWLPSPGSRFKPQYYRQLFVTTEKLTY